MTSITDLLNKKKQNISDKRMGYKNTYKCKPGITTIRILPGWRKDDPTFSHPFGQSFIKDFDGKLITVVGAKNITYGEDDAIQNLINNAKAQAKTDAQRKHWDEARAKPRELLNALILDDKEIDPKEPQLIDFSENMLESIIDQVQLNDIAETFLDLDEGFNLKVSRSGSGFNTKYTFVFDRKPSKVDHSVMDNINDIDAFIRSKMAETDVAINAIKSITATGEHLQIEDRSVDYSGSTSVVEDGNFEEVPWEVENKKEILSEDEIDNLFNED